jgi:hypothetical protein
MSSSSTKPVRKKKSNRKQSKKAFDPPELTKEITIGTDPEFFLRYNGEFVPAYLSGISGDKKNPEKLKTGGAVQVDGMALEFNTIPLTKPREVVENINDTLSEIRKMVDSKLEFIFYEYVQFPKKVWDETPKKYKILGCDPDFDYKGDEKTPDNKWLNIPERSAGGHTHLGYCTGASVNDPRCV